MRTCARACVPPAKCVPTCVLMHAPCLPAARQGNRDTLESSAFGLRHYRAGTVSLALSENDDDPAIQQRPGYTTTSVLITTGPGPVPRLDGEPTCP